MNDDLLDKLINDFYKPMSINQLAKKYKLQNKEIKKLLKEKSINVNRPRYLNKCTIKTVNEIINKYKTNISIKQLSKEYHLNKDTIVKILIDNGIQVKQKLSNKFSNEQINKILNEYQTTNKTITEISNKYNITPHSIRRWLNIFNIKIRKNSDYTKLDITRLQQAANYYISNDVSIEQAAKDCNIGKTNLLEYLQKHNLSKGKKQYKKYNRSIFHNLDTEEKFYWFGFIMADGCVLNDDVHKEYKFYMTLARKDENHLRKFINFMGADQSSLKERLCKKNNKYFPAVSIQFTSKELVKDLVSHGCVQRKTYNGFLSEDDFKDIDKSLIMAFIRGYIDGDGCFSKSDYQVFIVAYKKELIDFLNNLIIRTTNITPKIYYSKNGGNGLYKVQVSKKENYFKFCKMLYEDATVYLERKYKIYLSHLQSGTNMI